MSYRPQPTRSTKQLGQGVERLPGRLNTAHFVGQLLSLDQAGQLLVSPWCAAPSAPPAAAGLASLALVVREHGAHKGRRDLDTFLSERLGDGLRSGVAMRGLVITNRHRLVRTTRLLRHKTAPLRCQTKR